MNSSTSKTHENHADRAERTHQRPSLVEQCGTECTEQREDFQLLVDDIGDSLVQYCRRRPGVAVLSVFAVGFFFGWKLRP